MSYMDVGSAVLLQFGLMIQLSPISSVFHLVSTQYLFSACFFFPGRNLLLEPFSRFCRFLSNLETADRKLPPEFVTILSVGPHVSHRHKLFWWWSVTT